VVVREEGLMTVELVVGPVMVPSVACLRAVLFRKVTLGVVTSDVAIPNIDIVEINTDVALARTQTSEIDTDRGCDSVSLDDSVSKGAGTLR